MRQFRERNWKGICGRRKGELIFSKNVNSRWIYVARWTKDRDCGLLWGTFPDDLFFVGHHCATPPTVEVTLLPLEEGSLSPIYLVQLPVRFLSKRINWESTSILMPPVAFLVFYFSHSLPSPFVLLFSLLLKWLPHHLPKELFMESWGSSRKGHFKFSLDSLPLWYGIRPSCY